MTTRTTKGQTHTHTQQACRLIGLSVELCLAVVCPSFALFILAIFSFSSSLVNVLKHLLFVSFALAWLNFIAHSCRFTLFLWHSLFVCLLPLACLLCPTLVYVACSASALRWVLCDAVPFAVKERENREDGPNRNWWMHRLGDACLLEHTNPKQSAHTACAVISVLEAPSDRPISGSSSPPLSVLFSSSSCLPPSTRPLLSRFCVSQFAPYSLKHSLAVCLSPVRA